MAEVKPLALTMRVAMAACSRGWNAMPAAVQELARQSTLDWFGVALGGCDDSLVDLLLADAQGDGGVQAASVLGRSCRLSMPQAALVNGAASHALDFDDVHPYVGHPSVAILPAVLALGEALQVSGAEFLNAYVAGYEASCAVGAAIGQEHYARGFHSTSTLGVIGAAVACGRLLNLDREAMVRAIGIAASQASGLKVNFGTMSKPFHAGHAARNGLQAARLAAAGFTASNCVLDGPIGFLATLGYGERPWPDCEEVMSSYNLRNNLFKYHASCYLTHAAIDSALIIRRDPAFSIDSVQDVRISANPAIQTVCNIAQPTSGLELKFSIAHLVAMALSGVSTAKAESFNELEASRISALPLRRATRVLFDDSLPLSSSRVEVHLRSGQILAAQADSNNPANGLDEQRIKLLAKFGDLVAPKLGHASSERLAEIILRLEQSTDLSELVATVNHSSIFTH